MKKLIVLIGMMVLSSACLASNNLIYCPERIICTGKDDINSCKMSDNSESWVKIVNTGKVEVGTYVFNKAWALYEHTNDGKTPANCIYNFKIGRVTKNITVYAQTERLQAYVDNASEWEVDGFWAQCNGNRSLCPFEYVK